MKSIPREMFLTFLIILTVAILLAVSRATATPADDGAYTVSYYQNSAGLWQINLSQNHPNEIARLGQPGELDRAFGCQHEAVNYFYSLLGRLYGFALIPLPPPPGGC